MDLKKFGRDFKQNLQWQRWHFEQLLSGSGEGTGSPIILLPNPTLPAGTNAQPEDEADE